MVFVFGFLPLLLIIPLNLPNGISMIIGGLLMAAWCYFLKAKNVINIVTPLIPIPLWILGVVMAIAGVYGMVTNAWDKPDADVVRQEMTTSKNVFTPEPLPKNAPEDTQNPIAISKPDPAAIEKEKRLLQADINDLNKLKDKESEKALIVLEESLASMEQAKIGMEEISETIGQEKFDEMMNEQLGFDYAIKLEEQMTELRKQIAELKSKGYGAGRAE